MKISRRSFLATSSLASVAGTQDLLLRAPADAAVAPTEAITLPPASLRGYGTISAKCTMLHGGRASRTAVSCESPAKALLLQAKYLSDLMLLPRVSEGTVAVGGRRLPVRLQAGGGAIACQARGSEVFIFAATTPELLAELCAGATSPGEFQARAEVPMYLDRWDKHGLLIYYDPTSSPPGTPFPGYAYDHAIDLQFLKDNNAGLVLWANSNFADTAEGVSNVQSWRWVQENARRMGIPMHLNTSNAWPMLWLSNRYRDETQLRMPQFIGGYYDVGWFSGTQGAISWYSQAGEDGLLGALQQTVRRFAGDPNIVGWLEPHAETSQLPMSLFTEYGPVADRSLRQFLQQRYGQLATVSRRWTGDAHRYATWNDIHAPELAEFAGFGPEAIDLRGTWRVKYVTGADGKPAAQAPVEWYQPGFDDSAWDEVVAPGNDRLIRIPRNPLVYRRTVEVPAAWLEHRPQVTLYIWDLSDRPNDELMLYVNGTPLKGEPRIGGQFRWGCFDVTAALKPGANLLAINEPKGLICYRCYLTKVPPRQYPELGAAKNAQWADYNAWTLAAREAHMRRGVEMIRQVDPDRSINFMAPGDDLGPITAICKDYGCRFHDTGAMAGFWTDENTLMMTGAGLPNTAEAGGGAANTTEWQAYWGRWFTEGVTGIHYFQNLGEITWNPEILALFLKNRVMYESIGKYHVPFAEVALLFSTRHARLTRFPWDPQRTDRWQPAGYYSQANAAFMLLNYCPRDAIGEEALGAALARKYKVVVDSNSAFWNVETAAKIESYVRAGGVFITFGETGRHDEVQPDTWPVSQLSGYKVLQPNVYGKGLSASPVAGQQVFHGEPWAKPFSGAGQSLRKVAHDCQDLMRWSDGSVAVGMRPLGRGWLVHAGAWPGGGTQEAMLHQMLEHFGVRNRVPAVPIAFNGLRYRHFIGNSGLHDIWVLFNESDKPATTDLIFLPGVHPPSMTEMVSGDNIAISRDPAGDAVRGIALAPRQTLMYLSPRSEVAASPLEWLKVQRGWWQGTVKPPAKHLPTPAEQQRFMLDLTSGWKQRRIDGQSDEQAAALALPAVVDAAWERRDMDLTLVPGDHTTKRLVMRRRFTVPQPWAGGRTFLGGNNGAYVRGARTFLDGKPLFDGRLLWDGPGLVDLTASLQPGSSHVLTLDLISSDPAIGAKGGLWLYHLPDAPERQDLAGTWTGYSSPLHATGPVALPGKAVSLEFVARQVTIDSSHQRRNVVLYVTSEGGVQGVIINGRRVDSGAGWVNITPMVQFGAENTVELALQSNDQGLHLTGVELRYYDKGFFP